LESKLLTTLKPNSNGQSFLLQTEPSSQLVVSIFKFICFNALYSVSNNILAIHHASQKRPRSRTLKAVHQALLDDIVAPSAITGRTVRVATSGKRTEKIFLDPLDRELMEPRLEAMSHAYAKLTTHNVVFDFSKPTAF
jgi:hypothetical protein